MNKINNGWLFLREVIKVCYNPIFNFYASVLRLSGIIDFPVPPNSNMRRTSAKSIWRYWYSGLTTSLPIFVHAQVAGLTPRDQHSILDFGCGVGGQIRIMRRYFPTSKIFGCDVDPSSIRWLSRNYTDVRFVKTEAGRALPFDDCSFDFIYSVSTFSHFSEELSKFYLRQFARVVKPGGLVILTIEGIHAAQIVAEEWGLELADVASELRSNGYFHITYDWIKRRSAAAYKPISDAVDITTYFDDNYGTTVFDDKYFSELAHEEGFDLVNSSTGTCCDRQDIYVFRKRLVT